jgi:uncharacterized protein YqjF (DUF2071 family)
MRWVIRTALHDTRVPVDEVASMFTGDSIDRISATLRPTRSLVGRQRWRRLLFAHWTVDLDALRLVVPRELELDTFEGQAYVGIVPFEMRAVRGAYTPAALGLNFLETNLRTYVHVGGRDPGVYFLSLDASSRAAVAVARHQSGLPYYLARMSLTHNAGETTARLKRMTTSAPRLHMRYEVGDWLGPSQPGTLEHFLLERYFLHVKRRGEVWTMQVHHQPYPARRAAVLEVREGLFGAAGLPAVEGVSAITHYAEGVDVEIFGPWRTNTGAS